MLSVGFLCQALEAFEQDRMVSVQEARWKEEQTSESGPGFTAQVSLNAATCRMGVNNISHLPSCGSPGRQAPSKRWLLLSVR